MSSSENMTPDIVVPAAGEADPLALAGGRGTSVEVSGEVVGRLQKAFDAATVFLCAAIAIIESQAVWDRYAILRIIVVAMLALFVHLVSVRNLGGYDPFRLLTPMRSAAGALLGLVLGAIAAVVALAITDGSWGDWQSIGLGFGVAAIILTGERFVAARALSRFDDAGRLSRRVVIVGGGDEARQVIERLSGMGRGVADLCGFFDDRGEARTPDAIDGCPYLGSIDELVEFSRWFRIDLIVVAIPLTAEQRLYTLLKQLWVIPADIRISALGSPLRLSRQTYDYLGTMPLLAAFDRPLSPWGSLLKDVFDRIVAAIVLVAILPILALVAVAIKLDSPGPVLFRQPRYGFNNQLISIYKFRSMRVETADRHASKLVTRDDPRVTKIGRFIRRTSIDELPQLFNVLKGELSLVGPRPHAVRAQAANRLYDDVVDGYFARHRVKPGVTGWAQIKGWRGETDTAEKIERRVEHDLYYIDNWSPLFDLYILIRTPLALIIDSRNAY